jgi:hypothetical protein
LHISFQDERIRQLCVSAQEASEELGGELAAKLHGRLADMMSAHCLAELIAGNPRQTASGDFIVTLGEGFDLRFRPVHRPLPTLASGDADLERIRRVKLLSIGRGDSP